MKNPRQSLEERRCKDRNYPGSEENAKARGAKENIAHLVNLPSCYLSLRKIEHLQMKLPVTSKLTCGNPRLISLGIFYTLELKAARF